MEDNNSNKIVNEDDDGGDNRRSSENKKKLNGNNFGSPKLPNLKYLSFTDRVEATKPTTSINNISSSPIKKKLNSKEATDEIITKNKPKTLITTNSIVISDSCTSSSDEDCRIKNVKITKNGKTNLIKKENKDEQPPPPPPPATAPVVASNQQKQIRFETQTDKKDCHLRIMIPNGDRIDFITDGDARIKVVFFLILKLFFHNT